MKLLIISDMAHYLTPHGVAGWGATVEEIDHLAQLFTEVRHLGCLYEGAPPPSFVRYSSGKVKFLPLPPSGGNTLSHKLKVLRCLAVYARRIWSELALADAVHVRCPANVCLVAILLLAFARHPKSRWVKYAGSWSRRGNDPLSYRFQRWCLGRNLHRGRVTVNGTWPGQPEHVTSLYNPCLTCVQLEDAARRAANKSLGNPLKLLFVGRLEPAKGPEEALEVFSRIQRRGVPARLVFVGDGPLRDFLESRVDRNGFSGHVTFRGWVSRMEIGSDYEAAHLLLLPSKSEGWPKVIGEGMAFGVVAVASDVGSIAQYMAKFRTGRVCRPDNLDEFTDAVHSYWLHPEEWLAQSRRGVQAAKGFAYEEYLQKIGELFQLPAFAADRKRAAVTM